MQISEDEYARNVAIVAHAILDKSVEAAFPLITPNEKGVLLIDIVDRMARIQGFAVRRAFIEADDEE
jgi:hypothetical protein